VSNEQALAQYDVKQYRTPDGYTADIAVFTIISTRLDTYKPPTMELKLMLIKRSMTDLEGRPNIEAGKWALPGGFVNPDETSFQSAQRELQEETGVSGLHLKHFGVYDKPGRDPRGWIISNAHYAIVPEHRLSSRQANDDADDVELFTIDQVLQLELAFDHAEIISDAVKVMAQELLETTVAKEFLPKEFTYSELQSVLRTVTNEPQIISDPAFARKIKTLPFIQEVTGKKTTRTSKKPTQLYRFTEPVQLSKSIYTVRY